MTSTSASSSSSSSSSQFTYSNASYFPLPFHLQQSGPMAVSQYPQPYVAPSPPPVHVPVPPVKISTIAPVYPASAPGAGVYSLPQYQQVRILFLFLFFCLWFQCLNLGLWVHGTQKVLLSIAELLSIVRSIIDGKTFQNNNEMSRFGMEMLHWKC